MRIKLADADRERYDLPEWIEFDTSRPRLSDIRALAQAGMKGWNELQGKLGSDDFDDRVAGHAVVCWLAVRRHTDVSWDAFDIYLLDTEVQPDADPNPPAPSGASTE